MCRERIFESSIEALPINITLNNILAKNYPEITKSRQAEMEKL